MFTVKLVPINVLQFGVEADDYVGISPCGDAVLCARGSKELKRYKHVHNGEYREDSSVSLPRYVTATCYKEIVEDGTFIQQNKEDSITYRFTSNLKITSEHNNRGVLIGILSLKEPVYAESEGDEWIIQINDITLRPPSGAWRACWLSVCAAADKIIVCESHDEVLDVFTREGKNGS